MDVLPDQFTIYTTKEDLSDTYRYMRRHEFIQVSISYLPDDRIVIIATDRFKRKYY